MSVISTLVLVTAYWHGTEWPSVAGTCLHDVRRISLAVLTQRGVQTDDDRVSEEIINRFVYVRL